MEQKFGTAVTISERLIHTAYSNRLSTGSLHHEAHFEAVKYVNEIAWNSDLLSFVHQPSAFSWWKHPTFTNRMKKLLCWCSTFH
jgi:hypothetical protein